MSNRVQVRGYYRANGTYVKPHTRSAPTKSKNSSVSSCSPSTASTSSPATTGVVHVRGYYRANGTYVKPHTRSLPKKATSSTSTSSSTLNTEAVHVGGYFPSNGTHAKTQSRSAPSKMSSCISTCSSSTTYTGICHVGWSSVKPELPDNMLSKASGSQCCINHVHVASHVPSTPQYTQRKALPSNRSSSNGNEFHIKKEPVDAGSPKFASEPTESSPSTNRYAIENTQNRSLGGKGKQIPQPQEIVTNTEKEILGFMTKVAEEACCRHDSAIEIFPEERVEKKAEDKNLIPCGPGYQIQVIPYSDLVVKEEVGNGGYGTVYASRWNGKLVAYKKFTHQQLSNRARKDFAKEVQILVTLDHPHTVRLFGAVLEEKNVGFVMEYIPRTLFHAIFIAQSEFEEGKKKEIVFQLSSAIEYLHTHEREIAHCDVKTQNVLLDQKDNVKLADYGLSTIKSITESSRSSAVPARGTPQYSAPEVLRGEVLNKHQLFKADIYSLAICVFEVVTEEEPFYGLNLRQLEAKVGRENLRPTSDIALSKPLSDLLHSCWDDTAEHRPTASHFIKQWKRNITNVLA